MIQTEFEFRLPIGYVDAEGTLHRDGVMRLATAADEILPLRDARVQNNQAYLVIILLARVITRLGNLDNVSNKTIEGLYAADLDYMQEFYDRINRSGKAQLDASCPKCEHEFDVELNGVGG